MISMQIVFFLISFILTLFLLPLNIKFSKHHNLMDIPINRSIHKKPIPLAGGLSFAVVITLFEAFLAFNFKSFQTKYLLLIIANIVITFYGIYDDKKVGSPLLKLIVQIFLIVMLYFAGFKIDVITNPFNNSGISLGIFALPITIAWFLVVVNAINLIDGLDGLAAGIVFFTSLVLLILANINGFVSLALITTVMAGSMLAFLKYNFYPAKIFMGDTGSLFLGLNLAAISIISVGKFKRTTALTLLIPISTLIIPISDFVVTVFRRLKNKKNIMKADNKHLHHILLKIGLSQKKIAVISYVITFVFGIISIALSFAPRNVIIIIIFILLILIVLAYYFIYKERK